MNDIVCHKTFKVMGGEFQFSCFPQTYLSRDDVYGIFEEAHQEVRRIEEKFTDFKPSYFNRINESAGIESVHVDEETWNLLSQCQQISRKSQGLFDISFASIGHLWRKSQESGVPLSDEMIRRQLEFVNYQHIVLNEQNVFLPNKDMRIGLGGIGKGYAVDQVYKLFIKRGLYNFYINGSGDIRVHSRPDAPRKWRIGIRNPLSSDASKSVGVVQLGSGAIASSGGYIHNVGGDRFNNHIINPKTGRSAVDIISSTVLADDAVTADTTATILMNMNHTEALTYMHDHKMTGLVFSSEGKSYLSERAFKNFGM